MIIMFVILQAGQPAAALTEAQKYMFGQNNILFYDPSARQCVSSGSSTSDGGDSDGSDVYVIGDSISTPTYAGGEILAALPNAKVDAIGSTWFANSQANLPSGIQRLKENMSEVERRGILVFAMGTNGGVSEADISGLNETLSGHNVKVILMTIFYADHYSDGQMESTNEVVRQAAGRYDNISLMDWYSVASKSPSLYITPDAVHAHPSDAGAEKFAEIMKEAVDKVTKIKPVSNSSGTGGASSSGLTAAQIEFVDTYHDIAVELSIKYGIPWEAVMAQGILESASGTSNFAVNRNNFFGIGAFDRNPDNAFRYDTPELGWRRYYENIRITDTYRNHGVFSGDTVTDPYEYLAAIKAAGYATAENYVESVGAVIREIEAYMAERGWPSSAQIAAKNPEWFENAAKNAEGGQPSGGLLSSSSKGTPGYCTDDSSMDSDGVSRTMYNGFTIAFPLANATKDSISGGRGSYTFLSNIPCNHQLGCHYGEGVPAGNAAAAFDICFNTSTACEGATVVSLTDGKIELVTYERNGAQCNHVRVRNVIGQTIIAYMHLAYEPSIVDGVDIQAGDVIGHVSNVGACHDNSTPHVHIDKGSDTSLSNRGGPMDVDRDPELVNIINAAYEALPENAEELEARRQAASGGTKPVGTLSESSADIPCAGGTIDRGVYDNAHIGGRRRSR